MQDDDMDQQKQTKLSEDEESTQPEEESQESSDLDDSYLQDTLSDNNKSSAKFKKPKHLLMFKLFLIFSSVIAILAIAASTVTFLVFKDKPIDKTILANTVASLDTLETLPFTEDKSVFINPEKGFYKSFHTEKVSTSESTRAEIIDLRSRNISIIAFETNLAAPANGDYAITSDTIKNAPLTVEKIAEINNAFAFARTNGLKIVYRAAYTFRDVYGAEPTDINTLLGHIRQLKAVFDTNEDVLYTVQAGLLGAWGEWHSTVYGAIGTDVPYKYNDIPKDVQTKVVNELLLAVPKSRTIQIREPRYIRYITNGNTITDTTSVNGSAIAFDGSNNSRIGFHNDCMFTSYDDYGTYSLKELNSGKVEFTREQELAWANLRTKYVPYGGETCESSHLEYQTLAGAENAVKEFNQLHAQYVNGEYWSGIVTDIWKATTYNGENTFNYISRNLGYKYLLTDAQISSKVYSGGAMHLKLDIKNDGFGNLINERNPEIVISNGVNIYKAKTGEDARKWYRENGLMTKDMYFSIPSDVKAGTYNVYLNLPDKNELLSSNPAYSIRLANAGVWDSKTGYNLIKQGLVIEDTGLVNNNTFAQINRTNAEGLLGVTVNVTVSSVTLDKTAVTLEVGQASNLVATVLPVNVVEKSVSYASSNNSVATVDTVGKVTAIAPGTATITVTSTLGGKTASSVITVNAPVVVPTEPVIIEVSNIVVSPSSLNMVVGASSNLSTAITPLDATNSTISYVSSNPNIASVSSVGKVIAMAPGNITITATSVGSGKTSTSRVVVTQPVNSVSLPVSTLSVLVGTTYLLTGSVSPSNATNQAINYASSNSLVATIDSNGLVSAVGAGSATLKATSVDGLKTAICGIIVAQTPVTIVNDWTSINPVAQRLTGTANTLKIYNNQSTIYLLVNGSSLNTKNQFYIDADNNSNTGLKTIWLASGIDYLVENNNLYRYSGTNNRWAFSKIGLISLTRKDNLVGVSFALSKINLSVGSIIHVGFLSKDNTSNMLPAKSLALPAYTLINSTSNISF